MTYKISVAVRNDMIDANVDRLDGGKVEVRGTPRPSNITDASSGDLLATCGYGTPAYGDGSNGTATANSISSDTDADNSGDAVYFREYASGAGDTAADAEGDAGESGASPELVFDNATIVAGGTVAISSFTKTQPES